MLAPPRGLSQRATSFIASRRQGIHQMPLLRSPRPSPGTTSAPEPERPSIPCQRSTAPGSPGSDRTRPRTGNLPHATLLDPLHDVQTPTATRPITAIGLVGPGRIERPTSPLSGVRSDLLSYGPGPTTPATGRGPRHAVGRTGRDVRTAAKGRPLDPGRPGTLRKEVIQPQVPLRLPCYDFTPVADPTVDGCLPFGLAHRLQVEPTPMV